jgi:hypothetical protein
VPPNCLGGGLVAQILAEGARRLKEICDPVRARQPAPHHFCRHFQYDGSVQTGTRHAPRKIQHEVLLRPLESTLKTQRLHILILVETHELDTEMTIKQGHLMLSIAHSAASGT